MFKGILAAAAVLFLGTTAANALSLTTGFAGDGGTGAAAVFDLAVGPQDLTLTAIGADLQADPGVAVFIRTGSYVGHQFSATGWTPILNDAGLTGNGVNTETLLDVADTALTANQIYGIAIFVPDHLEMTPGTNVGDVAVSNADLAILDGGLTSGGFGNPFSGSLYLEPYAIQATIYYDRAGQPIPAPGALPLFAAGLVVLMGWRNKRRGAALPRRG